MAAKEKKEKKDKHSSKDGVSKSKKDKKSTSESFVEALADAVDQEMADASDGGETKMSGITVPVTLVKAALVPFANPLVEDKTGKKVLKGVKKSAKAKTLKRGVKEVVKALRKSDASAAGGSQGQPLFVCVLAADISPMDVISHIPVLCEDHGVPYVYVTSRAELGAAGMTKRPTSVVLVGRDVAGKAAQKGAEAEGRTLEQVKEEWEEAYVDLVKVAKKAGKDVRI